MKTPLALLGAFLLLSFNAARAAEGSSAPEIVHFRSQGLDLAGELFKRQAGIEMTHVPYRGAGPAFNDLIPGRVDAMINFTSSSLPLVRQGQLRALSVTTAKRLSVAPEVPTMA